MHELGEREVAPYKCLTVFTKTHQNLIVALTNHSLWAYYGSGGGVQDVFGGVVIHHEGIVTNKRQIVWAPDHGA